ncbi:MAG: hypothetical protein CMJ75_03465 [Planctomycetaceae bacterium]|nr:hypothetical protein [Planctomycetaceae bacterium]
MRTLEKYRSLLPATAAVLAIVILSDAGSSATAQEHPAALPQASKESTPAPRLSPRGQRWPRAGGMPRRKERGPIHDIDVAIAPGPGRVPASQEIDDASKRSQEQPRIQRNAKQPIRFTWKAPGLHHYPLYFEDDLIERQGDLRPLASVHSGIHFFASLAVLPLRLARPALASPARNHPEPHATSLRR